MADGSIRRGGPTAGPLLLAVIFLAVLGGGVGFSLGTLAKHQHNTAATQNDQGGRTSQDNGTGQGNGTGGGNGAGTGGGNGAGTGGGQNGKKQCLEHSVAQANAGPVTQV